jgi:hypothetical protein
MKEAFNKKKAIVTSKLELNIRKIQDLKCCIWIMALYGAANWTLWKVDQKYPERFETLCWNMMEQINWTDHVGNEKVRDEIKKYKNFVLLS